MKQFLTELRAKYRGARWGGPLVEAESLQEAKALMRNSPYKVVGELAHSLTLDNGDIQRFVVHGEQKVH